MAAVMTPEARRAPEMHCPYCGGYLEGQHHESADAYGILVCPCNRYPVIAGIPVLKRHAAHGVPLRRIISLIEDGEHHEALLSMLASSVSFDAEQPALHGLPGLGRLYRHLSSRAAKAWRTRLEGALAKGDRLTLTELLDLYYRAVPRKRPTAYDYFAFRFTQPRHLVALSLISLIHEPANPLLELCCGFGHITRTLVSRAQGQPVIGIDRSFFALFAAKNCVAPEASFICYDIDAALPFAETARFSAAVCVDGIHYIESKVTVIRETRRAMADDGVIILACSRNAAVEYEHAGFPLFAENYRQLIADMPHCLLVDADVLAAYQERRPPPLTESGRPERLAGAPLLSVVASRRGDIFRDHPRFAVWPHAEGRCGINPLYVKEAEGAGVVSLRRCFPSAYYERDHPEMAGYLPEQASITAGALAALEEERCTPEIERLIEQYVIVALPERAAPRPGLHRGAGIRSSTLVSADSRYPRSTEIEKRVKKRAMERTCSSILSRGGGYWARWRGSLRSRRL
jgi:SAM-dependent methyltransferase